VVTRDCVVLSDCLSAAAYLHYCADPDVTCESGRGCPLVVHYWADLQSVHGLCCYGNITRMRNVSECMLVLAPCLVFIILLFYNTSRSGGEGERSLYALASVSSVTPTPSSETARHRYQGHTQAGIKELIPPPPKNAAIGLNN